MNLDSNLVHNIIDEIMLVDGVGKVVSLEL